MVGSAAIWSVRRGFRRVPAARHALSVFVDGTGGSLRSFGLRGPAARIPAVASESTPDDCAADGAGALFGGGYFVLGWPGGWSARWFVGPGFIHSVRAAVLARPSRLLPASFARSGGLGSCAVLCTGTRWTLPGIPPARALSGGCFPVYGPG